jgi:hypothetical protein
MTQLRPAVTATTHVLPFDRLSPAEFERLCLWLVVREGYVRAEHYGLAGTEQGRDVIAYRPTDQGDQLWYFQCKRYRTIGAATLKAEVVKYRDLAREKPHLLPVGAVFVVSAAVSARVREQVGAFCQENGMAYAFWALTELDMRCKRHPDLLQEFFGLSVQPPAGIRSSYVPSLPPNFVLRPEVSHEIKAALLADDPRGSGILAVTAIQGLGGIGKTVLAAALVRDPDVQQRFADGILWVTLGQQPDLLPLLSELIIHALDDRTYKPTTVEAAASYLLRKLSELAVLLVVDDVWEDDHLKPFLFSGKHCRLLVTTRRPYVATRVGADLCQLNVMKPEQALELFSHRLKRPLEGEERHRALRVAQAVGFLPLALDLAAARVERGIAWQDLCQDLDAEIARLKTLEEPRRRRRGHTRLEACFNLSLDAIREFDSEVWRFFVWLGILPEDVTVIAPMAATIWGTSVASADDALELLWDDALLLPGTPQRVAGREYRGYRVHDLLHDIARGLLVEKTPHGLGLSLRAAHGALLDRYRPAAPSGVWHALPDDGYIYTHLSWHMEKGELPGALHELLVEETDGGENGWYAAGERLGQTAGYLTDVARAWRLADAEPGTVLSYRYALITASLNSLAGNIPAPLLAELVSAGIWGATQAVATALQVPDPERRVEALVALHPHLDLPRRICERYSAQPWMPSERSAGRLTAWQCSNNWSRCCPRT